MVQEECDSSHFGTIDDAIARMERIIEDVLWLAHEGRDIGETQAVDLRRTAERLWPMVSDTSDNVDLLINETGTQTVIDADADRLAQLLENIFRNAIDHGGSDVTVRFELTETGFAIEDDGPGIPPDEQEHILKNGYSTDASGTGLGLSIVERIVDAHGWDIHVTEGSEDGARFEIIGVEFDR
jgi:signal transduction histidine kinase